MPQRGGREINNIARKCHETEMTCILAWYLHSKFAH